jgi:hypothetical protein
MTLLAGMSGWHGAEPLPELPWTGITGALRTEDMLRLLMARWSEPLQIALLLLIVWGTPNSHQIMGRYSPALDQPSAPTTRKLQWQPSPAWFAATAFALAAALLAMHKEAKFLYFQF